MDWRRYAKEWETIVGRMGRWIDFKNDYKTMDPNFMVRLLLPPCLGL